jgi:argininosuccinate lyase
MKLWQKNTDAKNIHGNIIEKFTVGNDRKYDLLLAEHDVIGSIAHSQMLESIDLLSKEELTHIHRELNQLLKEIRSGNFSIDENIEDIHSQIELILIQRIGEAGKKIHSGRSRNDQVLLAIKLFLRAELKVISKELNILFNQLLLLSETHKDKLLPGYTHLQVAMPSSFGLWFGAYAESLVDDMELMQAAYNICNKNPLGSGAGYGSSFPLDRELTTQLLDFKSMNYNVVYAQMTRGKSEKIVSMALSSVAATLSRMAYDICLYTNQNFNFISFPDELTTGSSIMPHKKNPDVFELIRAKCNRIQALPNELTLLTNNLPSGYHRDLQLTKEILFPALAEITNCLTMTTYMLQHIVVNDDIMNNEKYKYVFSVESVNELVLKGTPFRDAYQQVGKQIAENTFTPDSTLNHQHEGSIGNLSNEKIQQAMQKFRNLLS